jgi:2-polyprenyl-6-methoxyphenol hydroxylase-like FAD-dependent oxidoreductase
MNSITRVLIVGGGIAGLTLAVALGRKGVKADVAEIKSHHNFHGVGIIQPGNALRALDSLGLMESCLAEGRQIDHYIMNDGDGNFIAKMEMLRIARQDLPAINGMPRPAVHRILTNAAIANGARIRLGLSVRGFKQVGPEVQVSFTDGSEKNYDLIVGADGIRSHVRTLIFGKQFYPQYTGLGAWRFATNRPPEVTQQIMYFGVGAKAGIMPISRDKMYLFLVTKEPPDSWFETDQLARLLRERLESFSAPLVRKVRDQIEQPAPVVYGAIEEVIIPTPWYKGNILLIGDAAHASSPHVSQGATMAIEDSVVLAELIEHGGTVDKILAQFMERRYERCKFVQDISRRIGEEGNLDDPKLCELRNERMRLAYRDPQPRPHEQKLAEPI